MLVTLLLASGLRLRMTDMTLILIPISPKIILA